MYDFNSFTQHHVYVACIIVNFRVKRERGWSWQNTWQARDQCPRLLFRHLQLRNSWIFSTRHARLVATICIFLLRCQENSKTFQGSENQASQYTFFPNPLQNFVVWKSNQTTSQGCHITNRNLKKVLTCQWFVEKGLAVGRTHTLFPSTQQQDIELYLVLSSLWYPVTDGAYVG